MPTIQTKGTDGADITFNYVISTPRNPSATTIDPDLPTLLFLHPVMIAQVIYQPQFADPRLRKFNLVAFDSRCHGWTKASSVPKSFGPAQAADDAAVFMDALKLPACHLVGLSMGCCIALGVACKYPQKVLSIFAISPPSLIEPVDVAEGRKEICDAWIEGAENPNDPEAAEFAILGALQLMFSNETNPLIDAMVAYTVTQAVKIWVPPYAEDYKIVTYEFFVNRKSDSSLQLQKVKCPIFLVHCSGDIAYTYEHATELKATLASAGIEVQLAQVQDAFHFGSVTHSEEINALLAKQIASLEKDIYSLNTPKHVISPFEDILKKHGWGASSDSEDSEIEFA